MPAAPTLLTACAFGPNCQLRFRHYVVASAAQSPGGIVGSTRLALESYWSFGHVPFGRSLCMIDVDMCIGMTLCSK